MSNPHNIQAGQTVLFVPATYSNERNERLLRVKKVGRKWAEIESRPWRFDLETLWVDGAGFNSPGSIKVDIPAWEKEKKRNKDWYYFRAHVNGAMPKHLTSDHIAAMKAIIDAGRTPETALPKIISEDALLSPEVAEKAGREWWAQTRHTNGPRTLEKYASHLIMDEVRSTAEIIIKEAVKAIK